jgi:hypothetical protein
MGTKFPIAGQAGELTKQTGAWIRYILKISADFG